MKNEENYTVILKRFLLLLFLLFASPIVLTLGFKAFKIYKEPPLLIIPFLLTILGLILVIYTVRLGFSAFKLLLDFLFKKNE